MLKRARSEAKIGIHWFRKGLRLHDNPAFAANVDQSELVYPIFIIDPLFRNHASIKDTLPESTCNVSVDRPTTSIVGANRMQFLLDSLIDLDQQLKALGSRLFVFKGDPSGIMKALFETTGANLLTFETDTEPYAVKRDQSILNLTKSFGINVIRKSSHTLFDQDLLLQKNGKTAPYTYAAFLKLVEKMGPPEQPHSTINNKLNMPPLKEEMQTLLWNRFGGIPTLKELGYGDIKSTTPLKGGETKALAMMEIYFENKKKVLEFEKPKTNPLVILSENGGVSTTALSPYLKFGCLSVKTFYEKLMQTYKNGKHSQPPVSLLGQIYWREHFYCLAYGTRGYNKMETNPLCLQINWDDNFEFFYRWKNAQTGYPFIDAVMTQLKEQGWIHHLARHCVACFLTRGDLYLSWELGVQVFEELLLDADYALNYSNWLWLSSSAFFTRYFNVYSPIAFPQKYDKTGLYVKRFLPVLANFPEQYIYTPWLAPKHVQERAKCIIGKDYPFPIVDHATIHKVNMEKMKAAYKNNKKGKANDILSPYELANQN